MVSILLLEEEYIYRKDALDLKPKVALSQILSPQLVHEPLCHIGSSRNNRHPWALMTQKLYKYLQKVQVPCALSLKLFFLRNDSIRQSRRQRSVQKDQKNQEGSQ